MPSEALVISRVLLTLTFSYSGFGIRRQKGIVVVGPERKQLFKALQVTICRLGILKASPRSVFDSARLIFVEANIQLSAAGIRQGRYRSRELGRTYINALQIYEMSFFDFQKSLHLFGRNARGFH